MSHTINASDAQDAFHYAAFACESHWSVFRSNHFKSLAVGYREAVAMARKAGINLSGLNLRDGSTKERARALMVHIQNQCLAVEIDANSGQTFAQIRADKNDPETYCVRF